MSLNVNVGLKCIFTPMLLQGKRYRLTISTSPYDIFMRKPYDNDVTTSDFRALSEFRYQIRRYLAFSDAAAAAEGLPSRQYQLLLSLKGLPEGIEPTIRHLAERLDVRHHSA